MKYFLSILLMANFAFANYTISYKGIELGEIKNFDTIKDNYLEADVTNSIARLLLGRDKFVFYNEEFKGVKDKKNIKYKKDKYAIIYILKKATSNDMKAEKIEVKKDKVIEVFYDKNFQFVYNSKGKIKSKGHLEMIDGQLNELIETKNDIEIIKKEKLVKKDLTNQ